MKIIAFAGEMGSGKSSAAEYLIQNFGFAHTFFAKRLKQAISIVYDVPMEFLERQELKNLPHPNMGGKTPRKVMQLMGTEGFRELVDQDTWINGVYRDIYEALANRNSIVITDLRFPNEAKKILEWGGHLVVVEDPNAPPIDRSTSHASELGIPWIKENCPHTRILNDKSLGLEALHQQVASIHASLPDMSTDQWTQFFRLDPRLKVA